MQQRVPAYIHWLTAGREDPLLGHKRSGTVLKLNYEKRRALVAIRSHLTASLVSLWVPVSSLDILQPLAQITNAPVSRLRMLRELEYAAVTLHSQETILATITQSRELTPYAMQLLFSVPLSEDRMTLLKLLCTECIRMPVHHQNDLSSFQDSNYSYIQFPGPTVATQPKFTALIALLRSWFLSTVETAHDDNSASPPPATKKQKAKKKAAKKAQKETTADASASKQKSGTAEGYRLDPLTLGKQIMVQVLASLDALPSQLLPDQPPSDSKRPESEETLSEVDFIYHLEPPFNAHLQSPRSTHMTVVACTTSDDSGFPAFTLYADEEKKQRPLAKVGSESVGCVYVSSSECWMHTTATAAHGMDVEEVNICLYPCGDLVTPVEEARSGCNVPFVWAMLNCLFDVGHELVLALSARSMAAQAGADPKARAACACVLDREKVEFVGWLTGHRQLMGSLFRAVVANESLGCSAYFIQLLTKYVMLCHEAAKVTCSFCAAPTTTPAGGEEKTASGSAIGCEVLHQHMETLKEEFCRHVEGLKPLLNRWLEYSSNSPVHKGARADTHFVRPAFELVLALSLLTRNQKKDRLVEAFTDKRSRQLFLLRKEALLGVLCMIDTLTSPGLPPQEMLNQFTITLVHPPVIKESSHPYV